MNCNKKINNIKNNWSIMSNLIINYLINSISIFNNSVPIFIETKMIKILIKNSLL
jgi:hypothetical protein